MTLTETVLFDFDGVLIRGDSFALFLRRRALVGRRRVVALAALPVIAALAVVPTQRPRAARLVSRIGLHGVSPAQFQRRVSEFGRVLAQEPGRVLPDGVAAVQRHLAAGDRVVVVTACEQTLARSVLDAVGLTGVELVGSRVHDPNGVVHNHGAEKVRQLAAHGIVAPWHVAYSDALSDLPILRGARRAVLVNAGRREVARARRILGDRLFTVSWPAAATKVQDSSATV